LRQSIEGLPLFFVSRNMIKDAQF